MHRFFGWVKRVTPLRIAMVIALVFTGTHFTIENEFFEHGPFSKNGMIHQLDLKALDLKFLSRTGGELPEPQVVIAAIDERGVERYGLWPWSRSVIADFITAATKGGAKVVGFDAVFSDEDRNASFADVKRFLDAYETQGLSPSSGSSKAREQQLNKLRRSRSAAADALVTLEKRVKLSKGDDKRLMLNLLQKSKRAVDAMDKAINKTDAEFKSYDKRATDFEKNMERVVAAGSPDAALAAAVKASPVTILGYFNFYNDREIVGISEEDVARGVGEVEKVAIDEVFETTLTQMGDAEIEMIEPVHEVDVADLQIRNVVAMRAPLPRFGEVAAAFGYFNVSPDRDGAMRRIRMLNKFEGRLYPSLSLISAARAVDGAIRPIDGTIKPGLTIDGININADAMVPTDLHGRMLVNYYTDPTCGAKDINGKCEPYFPTYSVADFIDGTVPPEAYQGKVVLFGMTALGLFDLRPTPFSANTPGVYIHAAAIQNIIDGNYLERYYGLALFELLAYLLLGLLMGIILPKLPPWGGALFTLGFAVALYWLDVTFVFPRGVWMLNVLPTLQATLTFIGLSLYGYLTEGKEKRQIRKAFQFYMTKSVVDAVLEDTSMLKLGGEKRVCTVLFSDIRGFTTISERLSPEQLVQLLNEYLTPMTNLVFKYDGTLDKYMGDAIMAIFGAPVSYDDHALRACNTSIEMMEELAVLQEGWRADGVPELDIGIGLNSGPMAVGNMGSEVRFDYTVMGDNVNLGARLEGINKQYGTNIIISESTYAAVKGQVQTRELDSVRVKGKREPVVIYELMGKGVASGDRQKLIETFEGGILAYKAQRWDDAIDTFGTIIKDMKDDDFASNMYIDRCKAMKETPPGEEWDGVFIMTTK